MSKRSAEVRREYKEFREFQEWKQLATMVPVPVSVSPPDSPPALEVAVSSPQSVSPPADSRQSRAHWSPSESDTLIEWMTAHGHGRKYAEVWARIAHQFPGKSLTAVEEKAGYIRKWQERAEESAAAGTAGIHQGECGSAA